MKHNNFELIDFNDDWKYLFGIIFDKYNSIFGNELMTSEECQVFNDSRLTTPMLFIDKKPIRIKLSLVSNISWTSFIYQLSHELGHYVIRQYKKDKNTNVFRIEEIFCEALSLYTLKTMADHWHDYSLSKKYENYKEYMLSFYENTYYEGEGIIIKETSTLDNLLKQEYTYANNRLEHMGERNLLCSLFFKYPNCIKEIIRYSDFVVTTKKGNYVDFNKWSKHTKYKDFINELSKIQPKII
jgi:hypothetical protein